MKPLKFTLINPQTDRPDDSPVYIDAEMISSWQALTTKYGKAVTLINIASGMGFAYKVDEDFNHASVRILEAMDLGSSEEACEHRVAITKAQSSSLAV